MTLLTARSAKPRNAEPTPRPRSTARQTRAGGIALTPLVQAKLRARTSEPLEREARQTAERVVTQPPLGVSAAGPVLQRAAADGPSRMGGREVASTLPRPGPGGRPLTDEAHRFFEPHFGRALDGVRIHTDSQAAKAAASLDASAFTTGSDIVFGAGAYDPDSTSGRRLIAHELTHVLQQSQSSEGSAPPMVQCQPRPGTPRFPDFPELFLTLEDNVAQNLFDYGHHFYRIASLYPGRTDLLEQAFGRYALGKNVLETGFGFLGAGPDWASRLALGTGVLFKGLTFASEGKLVIDYQLDVGGGLKLETSIDLAVNPKDFSQVRNVDVGLGLVGHF